MMHLEAGGRTYPIAVGELVIGSGAGASVLLPGDGVAERHALVQGSADGGAAVRACPGAEVLVNGVRLGGDPTPLLHGDKLRIGGTELLVVDARRAGRTQIMNAAALADATAVVLPKGNRRPSGGRVVCLTDGREYPVGEGPLVFGREAGADVVVPSDDVSRQHAEIKATDAGYVLMDLSANGTFVNGGRVEGARPLVRADIIRVGPDEFRFHADPDGPPPGAEQQLNDTLHGVRSTPLPGIPVAPPLLASLLGRSGALKGTRFAIRATVASVGRGEYNDVVLPDPSVSTMHAKLQRRDDVWVVVDLGSTNGTFVDDEMANEDMALSPGTSLRFGEVLLLFEPFDDVAESAARDTQAVASLDSADPAAGAPSDPGVAKPTRRRQTSRPAKRGDRTSVIVAVAVVLLAAMAVAFMMLT